MEAVIGAEESAQGTAPPAAAPKAQVASKPADVQVAAGDFDDDIPFAPIGLAHDMLYNCI